MKNHSLTGQLSSQVTLLLHPPILITSDLIKVGKVTE